MEDNRKVLYDIVYEKMFTVMNNYHPVSESLRELIYDNSAPVRFTKGELLLTENRECNVLFFIAGGFCSCFYNCGKKVLNLSLLFVECLKCMPLKVKKKHSGCVVTRPRGESDIAWIRVKSII